MVALPDHHAIPLPGAHAVVVGRSTVVGNPAAHLLLQRDATVTVCHSRTKDLAAVTRSADVLIAAVGRPELLTVVHDAHDAVVIHVGTDPTPDGGLIGDVDAASVTGHAAALTPVPGGVGPVTTALLLRHTIQAALHLVGSTATDETQAHEDRPWAAAHRHRVLRRHPCPPPSPSH